MIFYKFTFIGRNRKTIPQWFLISLVLSFIIASLHKCSGVNEDKIWDFIDVVQRHLVRKKISIPYELNDYIIKSPELLNRRIKRDVDFAIEAYDREGKKSYKPRMKNQDILREIESSKYTDNQRIIIKDAVYYEFLPDNSQAQKLLGPTMGIRASWVEPDVKEVK